VADFDMQTHMQYRSIAEDIHKQAAAQDRLVERVHAQAAKAVV
jgi:hypothetical protein